MSRKLMALCIRGNIVNKSAKLVFFLSTLTRFSEASFSLSQIHEIPSYDFKSH